MATFNGGKLYHIFQSMVTKRTKWFDVMYYSSEFASEHAKEAFLNGTPLLKVDGECSIIMKVNGEYVIYLRRDNYKGDGIQIQLPDGKQLSHYSSPDGKEHNYSYILLPKDLQTGKGKKKSAPGPDTYQALQNAILEGVIPDPSSEDAPEFLTFEWVGTKHQSDPDGLGVEHAMISHNEQSLLFPIEFERTFEGVRKLALEHRFEGLVFVHEDGTRYKVRCEMFEGDVKWNKSNKKEKTTIKPKIVCTKDGVLRF